MRFSLQDVRKSVHRRGGELSVSLHFLRPGELHAEISRLIAYYERMLGEPQCSFSLDEARVCVGDYRLANCLIAALSSWYSWQPREWARVVGTMNASADLMALGSPARLRLALYDYVNLHYHGFLSAQQRSGALQVFAAQFQISPSELEYLTLLDTESEELLTREVSEPPDAQAVATIYNQWVFEAALFNASQVRFVIDCAAFAAAQFSTDQEAPPFTATGIGSVIKQLCFLARRLGVYYDLEYTLPPSLLANDSVDSADSAAPLLTLTLYGPQDVTGAPQQYGLRLARLCRILLGYGVAKTIASQASRRTRRKSLAASIVQAEARIHFSQNTYTFAMTANLPELLLPASSQQDFPSTPARRAEAPELFDSGIEQSFSEAFLALATSQGADGWQLEREPEPLLLDKGLFIPDFALTRGQRRIYMEILGFWTPSYRERKMQKLRQLQERDDLLLALPVEAYAAFAEIAAQFPLVVYQDQLSASDVLQALRKHYDDFAQRLEGIDLTAIRERVRHEGFLAEPLCYELLHCFRRSELQQAAERVIAEDGAEIAFVAGVGLYHHTWLQELKQAFLPWLRPLQVVPLHEAAKALKAHAFQLQPCSDTSIETLLSLWPEVLLRHDSIFETLVEEVHERDDASDGQPAQTMSAPVEELKRPPRERRVASSPKKRSVSPVAVQGDLWGQARPVE